MGPDSSTQFITWFTATAVTIVPFWKAMKTAGMSPAWSLLTAIPYFGFVVALYVLAFGRWKTVR